MDNHIASLRAKLELDPSKPRWIKTVHRVGYRLCGEKTKAVRVECRVGGSDLNPYLAMAATLASGFLGMRGKLVPSKPHQGTANEDEVEVARTLEEGLRSLGNSPEVREVFDPLFLTAFAAVKRDEFEEFNRVISSWEREHLLLQV